MTISRILPLVAALVTIPAAAEGIQTTKSIPYADPEKVREAIRKECDLENKMAGFLGARGFKLVDAPAGGKVLDAKIADAVTGGGPWSPAWMSVTATLKDGGKVVGTVTAQRNTTRGRGACGRLAVAAEAVAEDLKGWAAAPAMDSKLGDAK